MTLQWLVWFGAPIVDPEAIVLAVFGGFAGGLVVVLWWLFFSRAPWLERLGAVALMSVGLAATSRFLDPSIETGMMGMLFPIYAVPILSLAFVVWAVTGGRLSSGPRRASMIVTILLACGAWAVVRTKGVTGDLAAHFAWRWTATPEQRMLAGVGDEPAALPPAPVLEESSGEPTAPRVGDEPAPVPPATKTPESPLPVQGGDEPAPPPAIADETAADWPGFRGAGRDGVVPGLRIETDWTASPPVELWRRPVGPGWSSFAVHGDLFYTQEQRGEDEVVACYRVATGEPVWIHRDAARFWESNGGAGPRATPTLHNGRVYTLGATGILNALDAANGAAAWSRDVAKDADTKVPGWGFSSSPLVFDGMLIIAARGTLVGYDLATGDPLWVGPKGGDSYSSPHLLTIDGIPQVALLTGTGMASFSPADGAPLWEHLWTADSRIVQPALTADGDILIGSGFQSGLGMRRIAVSHGPGGWTVQERWTSNRLKPYFNDFVVHKGHAFGFDGFLLASIDLEDGKRDWKGGRYGNGQLVLLPEQDLLLVLSERGELALVQATPDQFKQAALMPAIEGKTWNHPALAGDILLVRNGQEMAAFRLPTVRADPEDGSTTKIAIAGASNPIQ